MRTSTAKILFIHIEKSKQRQITVLCRQLGIVPVIVPKRQYAQSLGALAGIAGFFKTGESYDGSELSQEMLVFSGVTTELLDIFLAKYKEAGIAPVDLKAILTPNNIFWNVPMLYEELYKEHQAFH
jgi:hypothetical protein